jgi:hypothetical protein
LVLKPLMPLSPRLCIKLKLVPAMQVLRPPQPISVFGSYLRSHACACYGSLRFDSEYTGLGIDSSTCGSAQSGSARLRRLFLICLANLVCNGGGFSLDAFDGWAYATNSTLGWKIKLGF